MPPTAARRTQPLSIVGMVAGVVGVATLLIAPILGSRVQFWVPLGIVLVAGPIALITGVVAFRAIRREHLGGLWFALVGILLGLVLLVVEISLLVFALAFGRVLSTL